MGIRDHNDAIDQLPPDGSFWDSQRCCYRKMVLTPRPLVKEWDGRKWETTLVWSEEKSDWVAAATSGDQGAPDDMMPQSLEGDLETGGSRAARGVAWLDEQNRQLYGFTEQDADYSFSKGVGSSRDGTDLKRRKEMAWRKWVLNKTAMREDGGIADMMAIARLSFPGENASLADGSFQGRRPLRRTRFAVNMEQQEEQEDMLIDSGSEQAEDIYTVDETHGGLPPPPAGWTAVPAKDDPEYLQIQQELQEAWSQPERRKWSIKAPVGVGANDTEFSHRFNGQLQPAVAERLRQISNYLADEDVDRSRFWERHIKDVREYLEAIRTMDMSDKTLKLLARVEDKLKVHEGYEQWHAKKPRLPRVPEGDEVLPPFESSSRAGNIRTDLRKVPHHRPGIVNDLPYSFEDGPGHIQALRESQSALWSQEGILDEEQTLLARLEQDSYDEAIKSDMAWPRDKDREASSEWYALERGQRRAALQACLRMFDGAGNKAVHGTFQARMVPPVTAAEFDAARQSALGPFLTSIALTREDVEMKVGKQWHPHGMPYTKRMNRFWRQWDKWWDEARKKTEAQLHKAKSEIEVDAHNNFGAVWPSLPQPRSVYADVVTAQESYDRGLLGLCMGIVKMLERTNLVAPRPLIKTCLETYATAHNGEQPPEDIHWRDVDREGSYWRPLNVIELGFLRLLSTKSITPEMLCRLEDRGELYLAFAERLQRILDDLSEDNIFETRDTAVSVEKLLNEMHKGVDGPNQRTRFSVYDACNWLDRLQTQGRVRFNKSIKEYGYVQRPLAHVHPEYQISYVPNRNDSRFKRPKAFHNEFDAVLAPRPEDMVTWEEVVNSRDPTFWIDHEEVEWAESERARRQAKNRSYPEEPQERLVRPTVTNFFKVLSYRLGYTVLMLEERRQPAVLTKQDMSYAMIDWMRTKSEWDQALEGSADVITMPSTFVRVSTEMEKGRPAPKTEKDAVKLIGKKIIDEAEANLNNLYPTEFKTYLAKDGSQVTLPIRDEIWDWGAPEIRGRARQYFSLGRWPPHLQTEDAQENMRKDRDLDPEILWDPCAEDLTEAKWLLQKATPWQYENVTIKEGNKGYWFGDTKRQKEYIEGLVTNRFAEALLGPQQPKKGILSRLSGLLPSAPRPSTPANENDDIVPMEVDNQEHEKTWVALEEQMEEN